MEPGAPGEGRNHVCGTICGLDRLEGKNINDFNTGRRKDYPSNSAPIGENGRKQPENSRSKAGTKAFCLNSRF
jgi:hypothetical protein